MIHIGRIIKIGIIFLIMTSIYIYYQISIFKVAKISIKEEKKILNNKIKLIQISDYHNNNLINKKRLIKTVKKLSPDIIVLTGDIIDSKTENFDEVMDLLKDLKKINKNIYSVSGNHEMKNKKSLEFEERKKGIGINNLDYDCETLDISSDKINLCGIPFYKKGNSKKMNVNDLDDKLFTILLSHSPDKALEYEGVKSDLILSGHIHGGQVRIPLIGALVSPNKEFFPKYNKGLYDIEGTKLYIDSGLGNSVKPIRTFNRVQISYIEIK